DHGRVLAVLTYVNSGAPPALGRSGPGAGRSGPERAARTGDSRGPDRAVRAIPADGAEPVRERAASWMERAGRPETGVIQGKRWDTSAGRDGSRSCPICE